MDDFSGRVAVITGGASGIGLGLAEKCAAEGMKLVLADIEEGPLATAAAQLTSAGATVSTQVCDVSKASDVESLADHTYRTYGGAHLVANNAGVVTRHKPWENLDDWEWVLGVDLWGVIYGVNSFVPRMLEAGEPGHIMNTASTAGLLAFPGIASYNVAKRGVVALSETMHHELEGTSLSVSVLCPGLVDTKIGASERNRPGVDSVDPADVSSLTPQASEVLTPTEVADMVFDAIRNGVFWILPHTHYGHQALDQAERRLSGGTPVLPYIDRGAS